MAWRAGRTCRGGYPRLSAARCARGFACAVRAVTRAVTRRCAQGLGPFGGWPLRSLGFSEQGGPAMGSAHACRVGLWCLCGCRWFVGAGTAAADCCDDELWQPDCLRRLVLRDHARCRAAKQTDCCCKAAEALLPCGYRWASGARTAAADCCGDKLWQPDCLLAGVGNHARCWGPPSRRCCRWSLRTDRQLGTHCEQADWCAGCGCGTGGPRGGGALRQAD